MIVFVFKGPSLYLFVTLTRIKGITLNIIRSVTLMLEATTSPLVEHSSHWEILSLTMQVLYTFKKRNDILKKVKLAQVPSVI